MSTRRYQYHFETGVEVHAAPDVLFAELDDHERLSAHMMRGSAMTAGSAMHVAFDEGHGRAVGSHIRMTGRMMGPALGLDEVVTERVPPARKVWETTGTPRLLVIGPYRMGFDIRPEGTWSWLTIFIDYDDPPGAWRLLGRLLGPTYARWCSTNMARGRRSDSRAASRPPARTARGSSP